MKTQVATFPCYEATASTVGVLVEDRLATVPTEPPANNVHK